MTDFNLIKDGGLSPDVFEKLIPKAPLYQPCRGYGWICFCIFSDKGEIVDCVTLKADFSKGFSVAHGDLSHEKLYEAKGMWKDLLACGFAKRIVNGSLLH
jgi:hypothetical protein